MAADKKKPARPWRLRLMALRANAMFALHYARKTGWSVPDQISHWKSMWRIWTGKSKRAE